MKRTDGRGPGEIRPLRILRDYVKNPHGSVLIELGETRVICAASVEESIPRWMREAESKTGWVTAEYSLLPYSTPRRAARESVRGRIGGRTHEIQRLIGRSLRAVTDLKALAGITVWIDCDVIQAAGGTRTAAVTGGFASLCLALSRMKKEGRIEAIPIQDIAAAVSVGLLRGTPVLDLCYAEDFDAEVDMNVVMTAGGRYIEIQGTAEGVPFSADHLQEMLSLAREGIGQMVAAQREALQGVDLPWT